MRRAIRCGVCLLLAMLTVELVGCEQRPASEPVSNAVQDAGTNGTQVPQVAGKTSTKPEAAEDMGKLFARMWGMTQAPEKPARGTMWVFLPNGTLLETSCVETYRVALWSVDPKEPKMLRVVEDRQPAFTAELEELTDSTLKLRQKLTRTPEVRELTFSGVDGEVVCPDMR